MACSTRFQPFFLSEPCTLTSDSPSSLSGLDFFFSLSVSLSVSPSLSFPFSTLVLSLSFFAPFPHLFALSHALHNSFFQAQPRQPRPYAARACIFTHTQMSPTNMISAQVALHVYTDFDSTVVLEDTGNTLLEHEIGAKELERLDRLPETNPGHISLRKAEDMKWQNLRLTLQEAADILVGPLDGLQPSSSRIPFDQKDSSMGATRSYQVRLDPAFKEFHRFCRQHHIPITVVSM